MKTIYLHSNNGTKIPVGSDYPVRVNCNVGVNNASQVEYELNRIGAIAKIEQQPDIFMDLSTVSLDKPIYKSLMDSFGKPVGTVPSYLLHCFEPIEILKKQADDGIAFFTLHFTASTDLLAKAKASRKIACTSRGGSIVLQYARENVWMSNIATVIDIAKEYSIVISLGTTFRPASIFDACDDVHMEETRRQLALCKMLQEEGVEVIVENVGHIDLAKLNSHCELLREFDAPIMPLGPTPTDAAVNIDHIAAAIGATQMGLNGAAHIINCITAAEHSRASFTIEETLEAIKTARLAAHIVDVAKGRCLRLDSNIYEQRAKRRSCLQDNKECSRCAQYCPLRDETLL